MIKNVDELLYLRLNPLALPAYNKHFRFETMNCIYCNKENDSASLEHIIPQAIGGNLAGNLFKTRMVCRRCNSLMGVFVDGQYIKSYFTLANLALKSRLSLNDPNIKTLPLLYFGHMSDLESKLSFDLCELWISPCRSRVFHFHNNSEDRFFTYAGGNPIDRKKNGGLVIFCNVSDSELEIACGLRSFAKSFSWAERVVWGIETGDALPEEVGRKPNAVELSWIESYRQEYEINRKGGHKMQYSIEQGYADRLMGKIALGLGFNLFGESFLSTKYCHNLRNYLWERDFQRRQNINVFRVNSFGDTAGSMFSRINFPENKVTIILLTIRQIGLILNMNIFGDEQSIMITNEESLCHIFNSDHPQGIVYTLDPVYGKNEGPLDLMKYIAISHSRIN